MRLICPLEKPSGEKQSKKKCGERFDSRPQFFFSAGVSKEGKAIARQPPMLSGRRFLLSLHHSFNRRLSVNASATTEKAHSE